MCVCVSPSRILKSFSTTQRLSVLNAVVTWSFLYGCETCAPRSASQLTQMNRILHNTSAKTLAVGHRHRMDAAIADAQLRRALSPDAPPLHAFIRARRLHYVPRLFEAGPMTLTDLALRQPTPSPWADAVCQDVSWLRRTHSPKLDELPDFDIQTQYSGSLQTWATFAATHPHYWKGLVAHATAQYTHELDGGPAPLPRAATGDPKRPSLPHTTACPPTPALHHDLPPSIYDLTTRPYHGTGTEPRRTLPMSVVPLHFCH